MGRIPTDAVVEIELLNSVVNGRTIQLAPGLLPASGEVVPRRTGALLRVGAGPHSVGNQRAVRNAHSLSV